MLSIRLDKDTEKRLAHLAKKTGRSRSFYARKALEEFLEDREDYLRAAHALERDNGKRWSSDDIRKDLAKRARRKR